MTDKFTKVGYVKGAKSYLIFQTDDGLTARAYGRSTTLKKMIGDGAYKKLGLYKMNVQAFPRPMSISIDFDYVEETTKQGDKYYKIIALGGSPEPIIKTTVASLDILDNEYSTITGIIQFSRSKWDAHGTVDADGEKMYVPLYPEDKAQINQCAYTVSWDKPEIVIKEDIHILTEEHNGHRRINSILMCDTDAADKSNWVEVNRK